MSARRPNFRQQAEILLVEDNPGAIRLLQEAFKEGGLTAQLRITRDGEQALEYLRRQGHHVRSARPDLILLDLNLPRKNGWAVLEEIKHDTALRSTSSQDVQRAYDLHANCYLAKPETQDQLTELARHIESFWLGAAVLLST